MTPEQKSQFANHIIQQSNSIVDLLSDLREIYLLDQTSEQRKNHPNPLNRLGAKTFSQTDEDGITLEILRRIDKVYDGVFAEFGVGNGLENNTLVLKALGWRGFWVGGEDLKINPGKNRQFSYIKEWVTLNNVVDLYRKGQSMLGEPDVDLISMDLDGNDFFFIKEMLVSGFRPKVFIVEYNAKFLPPIEWVMHYDVEHQWKGDDYFGASLTSFSKLFDLYGYQLVCCNSHTGANAFFVSKEYESAFNDVPKDLRDLYVGPRYYLHHKHGHPSSTKVVDSIFHVHGS